MTKSKKINRINNLGLYAKKGFIMSDIIRNKISNTMKGVPKSIESRKKMSIARIGIVYSKETIEKMRNTKKKQALLISKEEFRRRGLLGAKSLFNKKSTSIEKKLYEELKKRGLLFETQKLINGRFLVDAYIPSLNLIIEADGDYWHNLERVQKKDKAENAYLTKCGYKLLRLSEREINDGSFKNRLN